MAQHDVVVPVPQFVVELEQAAVLGHAHDVDDPAQAPGPDAGQGGGGLGEEAFGVGPDRGVAHPRHPADLRGDVGGQVLVEVDAQHLGPGLGQRVAGLAPDPLPGPDHDDAAAVHAQHARVVGDLGVVRTRHRSSGTLVMGCGWAPRVSR